MNNIDWTAVSIQFAITTVAMILAMLIVNKAL